MKPLSCNKTTELFLKIPHKHYVTTIVRVEFKYKIFNSKQKLILLLSNRTNFVVASTKLSAIDQFGKQHQPLARLSRLFPHDKFIFGTLMRRSTLADPGGDPHPPPDIQIWRPQLYNLEAQCTI